MTLSGRRRALANDNLAYRSYFLGLSAAHVCADPPTMLVSIDDNTSALTAVLESRAFAINFLPAGAPVLNDALGAFDCVLEEIIRRGTTTIAIGRVVEPAAKGDGDPLIFFRGQYRP